ncbi:MAG: BamA/TamA family outer membrane protein, partial [Bacteroidia bacterium]
VERGSGNLRGYLRGRYAGRSIVYTNVDLRVPLLRFHSYLFPGFAGVLGFYDQGRVWNDNETSNTWHSGYGGGVWLSPLGMAIVNFTYAVSKEEKLFAVSLGFLF